MDTEKSEEEIEREINEQLSGLITNEIGPYTCQLFKRNAEKEILPFASGVLAELGGSYYILTASHVTEDWSNENPLFLKIHGGYISVVGETRGTHIDKKEKIDVAYIKLKDTVVRELMKGNKFLPLFKFRKQATLLFDRDYCVFGYPTVNHKIEDGKLKTTGAAYFVQPCKDKVFEYYELDPLTHYVLEFKGKGVDIKTGESVKIKGEHYGLSGCGLWYVMLEKDNGKYISDVRLVGIMTEFRRGKYDCLIGNRIEIILASLYNFEGLEYRVKSN